MICAALTLDKKPLRWRTVLEKCNKNICSTQGQEEEDEEDWETLPLRMLSEEEGGTYRAVQSSPATHGDEQLALHAVQTHHPALHRRDLDQTWAQSTALELTPHHTTPHPAAPGTATRTQVVRRDARARGGGFVPRPVQIKQNES